MPDIFSVVARQWKGMLTLSLLATAAALFACLLSPKKYAGVVTAVPSNSLLGDKARIFNQNVEALYTELGSPDELDRIEGTAKLDTLYLAAARAFNLPAHYGIDANGLTALFKAAEQLKKNTKVSRTAYGELQLKVWDTSSRTAASLANAMLQVLNNIHLQLRTQNTRAVLQKLKEGQAQSETNGLAPADTGLLVLPGTTTLSLASAKGTEYARLIREYELALQTAPQPLLVVEPARPALKADKPKTLLIVLLTFGVSILFTFLLALLAESRQKTK